MAEFNRRKKKICQMCAGKSVDYKDEMIMNKYVSSDRKKILSRRNIIFLSAKEPLRISRSRSARLIPMRAKAR